MTKFTSTSGVVLLVATSSCAMLVSSAKSQTPSSYGAYYSQQQITKPGANVALTNPNRYLYDKYFYQRPTVSPYLNMGRPGTDVGSSYQNYVRPELERREAAAVASRDYVQQRKLEGRVGETRYPGAGFIGGTVNNAYLKPVQQPKVTPSHYYNHWYGGWANR